MPSNYAAVCPAGRPPLFRPGSIIHTDGAKAYRNLGFYNTLSTASPPADIVQELLGVRPTQWRWESDAEREERWTAEQRESLSASLGRNASWAAKYKHLRLGHTAVVHKKTAWGHLVG
jgi:hypothetical protein